MDKRQIQEDPGDDTEDEEQESLIVSIAKDFIIALVIVTIIGVLLFSYTGVWPPFASVESQSMAPNIEKGDLMLVVSEDKTSVNESFRNTGVVIVRQSENFRSFGGRGHVIVFEPNGKESKIPIIHRPHFWVEDGENWYDDANKEYVGSASSCAELANCPAPNSGFITKGDANPRYDQAANFSRPVRKEWIIGVAKYRILS